MIILLSLLSGDLFTEEALVVQCNLGNQRKIQTRILLDTGATDTAFVDEKMAHYICKVLQILFIKLAKFKPIKRFDGRSAKSITYTIYLILIVQSHTKMLVLLFVTQLGQHSIILDKL